MLLYNDRKLARLRERARQAHNVTRDLRERIREIEQDIRHKRSALSERRPDGERPDDEDRQRVEQQVAPLERDLAFYEDELRRAEETRKAIGPVAKRCDDWLSDRQNETRVEHDPDAVEPEPVDAAKARKRLQQLQTKITDALTRRDTIEGAALTADEAKAQINDWIERQRHEFDSSAATLVAQAMSPDRKIDFSPFSFIHTPGMERDLTPMFAGLFGEQMREAMFERIDQRAPENALSAEDRAVKLAEVDAELDKLGRDEEAAIAGLEAAGETIHRRPDADPALILDTREVEDPPRETQPPQPRPRGEHSREAEATTIVR